MSQRTALFIILGIGIAGLLFSGYLSFNELFLNPTLKCAIPGTKSGTVFGIPACVYGFVMYLTIVIISSLGLTGKKPAASNLP